MISESMYDSIKDEDNDTEAQVPIATLRARVSVLIGLVEYFRGNQPWPKESKLITRRPVSDSLEERMTKLERNLEHYVADIYSQRTLLHNLQLSVSNLHEALSGWCSIDK